MTQPISQILTLQALTFLHPGTGQTTGVVDLPVQREVHSGHPMYASSGFKGSLRDKAEQKWQATPEKVVTLFGSEAGANQGDKTTAGSIAITDGRILAFPVRSLYRVFFWVTCPLVINRFLRDAKLVGLEMGEMKDIKPPPEEDKAWVHPDSGLTDDEVLILEEMAFHSRVKEEVRSIAEMVNTLTGSSGFDSTRLAILTNEDFNYFVEHATQISARIKLNDRKTTTGDGGNLWYEETLPPETILYAFGLCHKPRTPTDVISDAAGVLKALRELCDGNYLQIGGNETVGQGWCHLNLYDGGR